ncbi:MAG TPA: RNA polymerase sigma factor [Polyangiaceae bacterium]
MAQSPSRTAFPLKLVRPADDAEFVRRCVSGERAALRELFERERVRLHALLFRTVGPSPYLDDLLQEAFLEVFRSIASFRGESSLRTWIDRCTVRVAYAFFAREARVPVLESLSDAPSGAPDAEEHALLREATRRLYMELDRLEPRQRLAFTLFAIEGRSMREVADTMSSTQVAARVRVWRARQTLEARARKDPLLAEFLAKPGPPPTAEKDEG